MKFTLESTSGAYRITGYGPGCIVVNEETITQSVIVAPATLVRNWTPQTLDDLDADHLACLLQLSPLPEVVLLGVGVRFRFPQPHCLKSLAEAGIGTEVMDTRAACRTYNLLMNDGRMVAAALLIT
jgi:uncharacterized protein